MSSEKGSGSPKIAQVTVSSTVPTVIYSGTGLNVGVQIKNLKTNTGIMYLGGYDVSSTKSYILDIGESIFIPADEITLYRVLAAVNNEKICILPI